MQRLELAICLIVFTVCSAVHAQSPINLSCEHLTNPIGIDAMQPRLSWQLEDKRQGAKQVAYEIFAGTDSTKLLSAGKVKTDQQLIIYKSQTLQSFTRYYWKVKIWDKENKAGFSSTTFFETGMLSIQNWKGSWVSDTRDINLKPAAYFRKTFAVPKKIKSARAYIACAGLYELYINGKQVGDHRLDPIYTRFDRRTLYVTYDITKELQNSQNCIGVLLGNGWYNHQSTAVWYFHEAPWRSRPSFCMDLRITYTDGLVETISTGKDWKTALSPVTFNSIYTAEHYDARSEIPHWNEPAFNDSAWKDVIYRPAPSQNIVSQQMVPIRDVEHIPAKSVRKFSDTFYVFDLGRNIAGVSEIRLNAEAGAIIKLKHGERLYSNGHVDQSNIDVHYRPTDDTDPFQTDIYISKGGEQTFRPRFNYKGFQYIEVTSNKPIELSRENLSGYFMHSDVPIAGLIQSSDSIINKIATATNNSYLSNLFGYPTDCPQREKNGWTGDAQIAIQSGLYAFDGITVYEKWMADHRDEQQGNGVLPSIIPTSGWGYEWGNGPDWTSTIAIIPWEIYQFYGDNKLLKDCYENIKRYVDHINDNYPSGLTDWGLGDWVPVKSKAPKELTSTCYYYADAMILARAAKLVNHPNDYTKYIALAQKIKSAFNTKYLDTTKFIYGSGLQTELSAPLYWGLVPDEYKSRVANSLADRVISDSTQLDVGLLGTKAILNALSDNGYADLAYQLAARRTYPSWGWWMVGKSHTAGTRIPDWGFNYDYWPSGFDARQRIMPTQTFVNMFQMTNGEYPYQSDGITVNPASGYDPQEPNINRDARYYSSIIYPGAGPVSINDGAKSTVRTYEYWEDANPNADNAPPYANPNKVDPKNSQDLYDFGRDSKTYWVKGKTPFHWRVQTGYTFRRLLDFSGPRASFDYDYNQAISFLRLAEFYLNYAEIQIALGNEGVAREYLNKVRKRPAVNMPDIATSGADLVRDYRNERAIELHLEDQRFFDLMRWKAAPGNIDIPVRGLTSVTMDWTGAQAGDLLGKLSYTYGVIAEAEVRSAWKGDYYYLLPIPREEIKRSHDAIKQNPGYQ